MLFVTVYFSIFSILYVYCMFYIVLHLCLINKYKMLSYRRETALRGALWFLPKVEDGNWETIFYGRTL